MKGIVAVVAIGIVVVATILAGLWGLLFGVLLALSCLLLVASLLGRIKLRGGSDYLLGVVALGSLVCILVAWQWDGENKEADGSPNDSTATAPSAGSAVSTATPAGPTSAFYPFGADGCYEQDLGYKAQWSPNKGAMRVYDPSGGSHVERLGTKSATSAFGPGHWKFCAERPDAATGVVIWE